MKALEFSYQQALVSKQALAKLGKKLLPEIKRVQAAQEHEYNTDYASINLCTDPQLRKAVEAFAQKKAKEKPALLVVVGIGGSNLGTIAVQEAVLGKKYNALTKGTQIQYVDTVDADSLQETIDIMESFLKKKKRVVIHSISKSGSTTETIANTAILVKLLKKYKGKQHKEDVIITTNQNSAYWKFAQKQGYVVFPIPEKVGGRYSVFSPVGTFPLQLIGIDTTALHHGACIAKKRGLEENIFTNPSALSAAIHYVHFKKGINMSNHFFFSNDLESLDKWYRQLMGESIGKEKNKQGKKVFTGMTPTMAIGSTDLHSMAQLYLGGPTDKLTTFLTVKPKHKINIPKSSFDTLVTDIGGKSIPQVMDAIVQGVQKAFVKGKRPYMHIILPDKSPASIGQLLQMKMMEMMYLGFLMNVNPFDQPNVEAYKKETRKVLKRN